jgi:sugar/nucleoside kinase (ribokinase family)
MDQRDTLDLQLGVFAGFRPEVPAAFSGSPVLFLANVDPDVQLHVLGQARGARLVACDTIDHWIQEKRPRIDELFSRVDLVFLNEDEARLYADTPNLHVAAARILDRGCRAVCLKKGENGALAYLRRPDGELSLFACPAYPLEAVVDPTGAGDAFAGGVIGHLARTASFDLAGLRQAVAVGTVMASFNVEAFGPAALAGLSLADVRERAETLRRMLELELSQL